MTMLPCRVGDMSRRVDGFQPGSQPRRVTLNVRCAIRLEASLPLERDSERDSERDFELPAAAAATSANPFVAGGSEAATAAAAAELSPTVGGGYERFGVLIELLVDDEAVARGGDDDGVGLWALMCGGGPIACADGSFVRADSPPALP